MSAVNGAKQQSRAILHETYTFLFLSLSLHTDKYINVHKCLDRFFCNSKVIMILKADQSMNIKHSVSRQWSKMTYNRHLTRDLHISIPV